MRKEFSPWWKWGWLYFYWEKKEFQDRFKSTGILNSSLYISHDGEFDPCDQYELKKYILCCTYVADETNQNISNAQKNLLHWHQNLCINMRDFQQLTKLHTMCDQKDNILSKRPQFTPIEYKSVANLKHNQFPMCVAYKSTTTKIKSFSVFISKLIANKEGALYQDQYEPRDNIAAGRLVVKTTWRLCKGYGCEAVHDCVHMGRIFQDTDSNRVWG